jgi:hypothetical protein
MKSKSIANRFVLVLLALVGARTTTRSNCCCLAFRPPLLSEELGCSPTLSLLLGRPEGFYFDPLGFATDANFARLREAELKHGRVAMLANFQIIALPLLKILEDGIAGVRDNYFPGASILQNLGALDPINYLRLLVTCGFLESFIFIQRDPKDLPGDYGTGFFGVRDKGTNERALISELENGRLAMIAITSLLTSELISGRSWIEQWDELLQRI